MGKNKFACHDWIAASREERRRASKKGQKGHRTPVQWQGFGQHGVIVVDCVRRREYPR